jgi:hypothetical protein
MLIIHLYSAPRSRIWGAHAHVFMACSLGRRAKVTFSIIYYGRYQQTYMCVCVCSHTSRLQSGMLYIPKHPSDVVAGGRGRR